MSTRYHANLDCAGLGRADFWYLSGTCRLHLIRDTHILIKSSRRFRFSPSDPTYAKKVPDLTALFCDANIPREGCARPHPQPGYYYVCTKLVFGCRQVSITTATGRSQLTRRSPYLHSWHMRPKLPRYITLTSRA